jgi:hypothetical protein
MPGNMRDPGIRLEIQDPRGEGAQHGADIGDPGHRTQVLVLAGELAGDPALPAVDQRERHDPKDAGDVPQRESTPPRKPSGKIRTPGDHGNRQHDRQRRADADMRQPLAQDRPFAESAGSTREMGVAGQSNAEAETDGDRGDEQHERHQLASDTSGTGGAQGHRRTVALSGSLRQLDPRLVRTS